ncbi:Cytoplasmic tRNA 2-thiolation protein 2 [Globomyces sp. JEL0801]|nr:Cytoplasmic tRNA 2-thiolation protein 2 [Globomyces sp. JEL0801]
MLDLMSSFSAIDPTHIQRKPRYPYLHYCHVDQSSVLKNPTLTVEVENLFQKLKVDYSIVKLESIFEAAPTSLSMKDSPTVQLEVSNQEPALDRLTQSMNSLTSLSSKEDILNIYTLQALHAQAKKQNCNVIFLGDNSTLLAIRVISNTSKGRGLNLPSDMAVETVIDDMLVVRPIRDILAKEVAFYNRYRNLEHFLHPSLTTTMNSKASIDKLTADFINGLESEFPSTVSTITRTAFKIKSHVAESENVNCPICNGPIDSASGFSKIESAKITDTNPMEQKGENGCDDCDCNDTNGTCSIDQLQSAPLVICYACKNITQEIKKTESSKALFPNGMFEKAVTSSRRAHLRNEIAEFLLTDEDN